MSETPELDKMRAVRDRSQIIGEFLEWLTGEEGTTLCKVIIRGGLAHDKVVPCVESTEKLLGRYFGIDLDAADREQRKLLEELRINGKI